jgi:hypothetical protein
LYTQYATATVSLELDKLETACFDYSTPNMQDQYEHTSKKARILTSEDSIQRRTESRRTLTG